MSTVRLESNELVDTKVQFVSIVKRGANRIPFRITKEDGTTMGIDLHKIGMKLFNKAERKPAIVAVILAKADTLEAVAAKLTEAGLDISSFEKSEKDGTLVLTAKGEAGEDALLVKLDDNTALMIDGLKKGFDAYGDNGSTMFSESMSQSGYIPSIYMANDALTTTFGAILDDAKNPADAATAIAKACDDFKAYLVGLTSSLPVQAFKAEQLLRKADKVEKAAPPAGAPANWDELTPAQQQAWLDKQAAAAKKKEDDDKAAADAEAKKKAEDEAAAAKKNEGDEQIGKLPDNQSLADNQSGAGAQGDGEVDEDFLKAIAKTEDKFVTALEALQKSFEEKITGVLDSVQKQGEQVAEVAKAVAKTDAKLKGTTFSTPSGDDEQRTQKSERAAAPPLLDTALTRNRARTAA